MPHVVDRSSASVVAGSEGVDQVEQVEVKLGSWVNNQP